MLHELLVEMFEGLKSLACPGVGISETQFRVFPKPLVNLGEHLQGSFESGINVRVICKSCPLRTLMTG
jgi:hypothetical protein